MPVQSFFPKSKEVSSIRVQVFVPSTSRKSKKITKKMFRKRLKNTAGFMTRKFGGSTRTSGIGTFTSSKGAGVIEERVGIVESYVPKSSFNSSNRKDMNNYLREKKESWGQEEIGVVVESPKKKASTIHFV